MEGVGEERLGAGKPVAAMHPIVHRDNREAVNTECSVVCSETYTVQNIYYGEFVFDRSVSRAAAFPAASSLGALLVLAGHR